MRRLLALSCILVSSAANARTVQLCLSGTTPQVITPLASRRAVEIYNADTVTVCCAQGDILGTNDCRPLLPGNPWSLDVNSGYKITCRAEAPMTGSASTGGCLRITEVL